MIHPPRPPLVFRVGVVGHRPNRLGDADLPALRERLGDVLQTVRDEVVAQHRADADVYDATPAVIRALSPLAEGVDRIFAEQALAAGCELTVVLPFPQAEFENDFTPESAAEADSLARFRGLLAQARTVFQLDGTRADESQAYQVAGDVVLNQSDLLVVVWDGVRKNLRGGTEETFDDAVARGVPIIWIDAHAPHHWRLLTQPMRLLDEIPPGVRAALLKSHSPDRLREQVRRLIAIPPSSPGPPVEHSRGVGDESPREALELFLGERQPAVNPAIWWKWFRDIVGSNSWRLPRLRVIPYEDDVEPKWPRDRSQPAAVLIDRLRPYYAWSDKLADRYADCYRSAFVVAFGLAAFAVAMALASIGLHLPEHGVGETVCALGEATAICLILFIVFRGRSGQWHRRWLDYRLLAEILRHQRLVSSLGGRRASPSVPEHWSGFGDVGSSWMAWYARGVERWLGLSSAVVDRHYLEFCLRDLKDQLGGRDGQIAFHRTTSSRTYRIEHRLHIAELTLLFATLACCIQHLAQGVFHYWPQAPGHVLTFCCGFFPALGAALAGISNQGEFRRLMQRSRSMSEKLQLQLEEVAALQRRLAAMPDERVQLSAEITRLASDTARLMVNEVLDWRIIFQDQPLRTT